MLSWTLTELPFWAGCPSGCWPHRCAQIEKDRSCPYAEGQRQHRACKRPLVRQPQRTWNQADTKCCPARGAGKGTPSVRPPSPPGALFFSPFWNLPEQIRPPPLPDLPFIPPQGRLNQIGDRTLVRGKGWERPEGAPDGVMAGQLWSHQGLLASGPSLGGVLPASSLSSPRPTRGSLPCSARTLCCSPWSLEDQSLGSLLTVLSVMGHHPARSPCGTHDLLSYVSLE